MEINEKVKAMLVEGESVQKEYKPNKIRGLLFSMIPAILLFLVVTGFFVLFLVGTSNDGGINIADDVFFFVAMGVFYLIDAIMITANFLRFNKYIFIITNKRIIMGHGVIGQDFSTIEFKDINATEVYVDLLDKINGSKTGNIIFLRNGNTIMPGSARYGTRYVASPYAFKYIEDPYNTYKEVKDIIDKYKEEQEEE